MHHQAFKTIATADPVQALRSATQALHQQLDSQLPLAQDLPDAAEALRRYHQHLSVLHGWLQTLAPMLQVAGWGQTLLPALRADLSCAGHGTATASPLPAHDAAFAWGVAYVAEGSQLGGRVLLQRLRQAGVVAPLGYLQGRGAATGAHWSAFLQAARAALAAPADTARACEGACWAFDDLLARFRRLGLLA